LNALRDWVEYQKDQRSEKKKVESQRRGEKKRDRGETCLGRQRNKKSGSIMSQLGVGSRTDETGSGARGKVGEAGVFLGA